MAELIYFGSREHLSAGIDDTSPDSGEASVPAMKPLMDRRGKEEYCLLGCSIRESERGRKYQ